MSRHSWSERRERRQALDEQAELGETWLAIREAGAFVLEGCGSWEEYVERVIVARLPARWRLDGERARAFVAESVRLAELRRRGAQRR